MGLAGAKQNTKIGKDPRNTHWSNDTSRFGHKHLSQLGWSHGKGLGFNQHGDTAHIKVTVKRDNTGLGAKKRSAKGDDLSDDFVQGLDVFQKILGRLNGKEEAVERAIESKRRIGMAQSAKFGMVFVYGGLLKGTIDEDGHIVKEGIEVKTVHGFEDVKKEKKDKSKKRKLEEEDSKKSKKSKKSKSKDSSESKSKSKESKSKSKDSSESKSKNKESKSKNKESSESKSKNKESKSKNKESKSKSKESKSKSKESKKKDSAEPKDPDTNEPKKSNQLSTTGSAAPSALKGIHATRSRWIRSKRAATMDTKGLNEIFMVAM